MGTIYKLTDRNMCTMETYKWELGEWHETSGKGPLCGPGWLHCYTDPYLAVFLNPPHANLVDPRLYKGEGRGKRRDDHGLKCGYTQMRIIEEIPVPEPTREQYIEFAIRCAMAVYSEPSFVEWANNWLDGTNRTAIAAAAIANGRADYAARSFADAAAVVAAYDAAYYAIDLVAIAHQVMG